jgi:predicted metal-binding membrane protein
MMILLATGVMNLGAMAVITAAITAERLLPHPERVARAAGAGVLAAAAFLIARDLGMA